MANGSAPAERDMEILQLKLSGASTKQICKRFNMRDRAVGAALDRVLPSLSEIERARYWRSSVATLDRLQLSWTALAQTSPVACGLLLRILDQRALLLGINAPARLDLQLVVDGPAETSTTVLLNALNAIANERPAGGPVFEGDSPTPAE